MEPKVKLMLNSALLLIMGAAIYFSLRISLSLGLDMKARNRASFLCLFSAYYIFLEP